MPYKQFLGYEKGEDGKPCVVPEQAEIVKKIYRLFVDGMMPSTIATHLTKQGIPTPAGKKKWQCTTVESILTNEKYKHLLLAYTNISFETCGGCQSRKDYTYIENDWEPDDNQWIDCFFDERRARENVYLMQDFFDVFRTILDNDTYEKSMRLLLNSAQELFCAKLMICNIFKDGEYNIPGYVDIINTVLISALEPLSMIGKDKPQHCQLCGNIMYKISKSIQLLCEKYLGENVAKGISNIAYGHRSFFVHEGNPVTNEFYCGHCVPLINPNSGNEMLGAISSIDMNLFEFGTYIFRQVVHDLLLGNIPER